MAIHSTASLANVYDSLKKFFVDNLYTVEGISTMFDRSLSDPATVDLALQQWVVVNYGEYIPGNISTMNLDVYCCTREDVEGYNLIRLRDTVLGYLTDATALDGKRRIKLWQSHPTNLWTEVGGMVLLFDMESQLFYAPDETKYKALGCTLMWGSII
jgi:hypothetical protein